MERARGDRALHQDRSVVHMEEARAVQLRERIAPGAHGMHLRRCPRRRALKQNQARDRVPLLPDVPASVFLRSCLGTACRSWRRDRWEGLAQ